MELVRAERGNPRKHNRQTIQTSAATHKGRETEIVTLSNRLSNRGWDLAEPFPERCFRRAFPRKVEPITRA